MTMGSLINYPDGIADVFEYITKEKDQPAVWKILPVEGQWFPHAFIGSMEQLMLASEGAITAPDNSVKDALHTMACVEAAYASSKAGGIKPDIL